MEARQGNTIWHEKACPHIFFLFFIQRSSLDQCPFWQSSSWFILIARIDELAGIIPEVSGLIPGGVIISLGCWLSGLSRLSFVFMELAVGLKFKSLH